MKQLWQVASRDEEWQKAGMLLTAARENNWIHGLAGTAKAAFLADTFRRAPRSLVVLCANREALESLRADLAEWLEPEELAVFPTQDLIRFAADARSLELTAQRAGILSRLYRKKATLVLTSIEAVLAPVASPQEFAGRQRVIRVGEQIGIVHWAEELVQFGYERVLQVETPGQFTIRGGMADVFPVNHPWPVRLEWFGDEVETVREFDPTTQRTARRLTEIDIAAIDRAGSGGGQQTLLFSYLAAEDRIVMDEPGRLREQAGQYLLEQEAVRDQLVSWSEFSAAAAGLGVTAFSVLAAEWTEWPVHQRITLFMKPAPSFQRRLERLTDELRDWLKGDYAVLVLMTSRDKALHLHAQLAAEGIAAYVGDREAVLTDGAVCIGVGGSQGGFVLPGARLAFLTERDIWGIQKQRRLRSRGGTGDKIQYFRDIRVGDYVVHVQHGIGRYVGVETLAIDGLHRDYLHIRYAGQDKLYVPTDQVHLLQKYIGSEGEAPRLSRMGGTEWVKAKSRAKESVTDLARELIALYAERQALPGIAAEPDTTWQKEFEDAFPYEETPDQLTAIAEIKADMEQPHPMDRLLCGDVGFGKTEVALRAAFKAVMSGKQVAVLVPTTVLAQQHYQTFSLRFAGFGPTVDVVSRFRSAKEHRQTLAKVAGGQVDVLIGTHRLLQADVQFKDLGLLIVDEEQRFGVAQKERLKNWKKSIDVLTLTATPIPRTLHMSLVGSRDMSVIETPPEDRHPVQTYVLEYRDDLAAEAIRREMRRGGQVYFVYNRVQSMDKMRRELAALVPEARIMSAHGQMAEELLEQVMFEFYEGRYDVLLCTSIIENGLDVANANTIIVYDADRFGLSQLYQMRGRVGRSQQIAYGYFTYRRGKVLSEIAEKRLQAMREFAELGAGFKIAMRDLEIRGAGNLLGAEQHGNIVTVGFEMYCRLLEEAVEELRSGRPAEITPEPVLEIPVEAYLSGDYIADPMHKIEMYQRIAAIRTDDQAAALEEELRDRFGTVNEPAAALFAVARLKNRIRKLGVRAIVQKGPELHVQFIDQPPVGVEEFMALKQKFGGRVDLLQGPPITLRFRSGPLSGQGVFRYLQQVLEGLEGNRAIG